MPSHSAAARAANPVNLGCRRVCALVMSIQDLTGSGGHGRLGHETRHFNVGQYRRRQNSDAQVQDASFFDHNNPVSDVLPCPANVTSVEEIACSSDCAWLDCGMFGCAVSSC